MRRLGLWQNGSGEAKTAIRVEIGLLAFLLLLLFFWVFTLGTIFTESGISNELNKRHVKGSPSEAIIYSASCS